jgi:DNA-binding CsgD family transcriptional regulator
MHDPFDSHAGGLWLVGPSDDYSLVHPLRRSGQAIGRSPLCELRINDKSVSRRHAEIRYGHGLWVLRDLGSKNGTFVNGERVERAVLESCSHLRFGSVELRVVDPQREATLLSGLAVPSTVEGAEQFEGPSANGEPEVSPAQRRVLQLLLTGRSEKEIAKELHVSRHTVHNHISAIYATFAVHSRAELLVSLFATSPDVGQDR